MDFDQIKAYFSFVLILSTSVPGEELYLYIANTLTVVSAVLVRIEENKEKTIYFISKSMISPETIYSLPRKLFFYLHLPFQTKTILLELESELYHEIPSRECDVKIKRDRNISKVGIPSESIQIRIYTIESSGVHFSRFPR